MSVLRIEDAADEPVAARDSLPPACARVVWLLADSPLEAQRTAAALAST